jgi:GNAT superfamily N-acetyltransferase
MPPPLVIREATPADVSAILSLIRGLAEYAKLLHEVVATEDGLREVLFGERRHAEVLLAESGTDVLGFALFFHSFSTFLGKPGIYVEDVFVWPEHRDKGIGRALFDHIARVARERDCGRIEWSVLDWNEPAIGFYERMGARPLDDWTMYRLDEEGIRDLSARPEQQGVCT